MPYIIKFQNTYTSRTNITRQTIHFSLIKSSESLVRVYSNSLHAELTAFARVTFESRLHGVAWSWQSDCLRHIYEGWTPSTVEARSVIRNWVNSTNSAFDRQRTIFFVPDLSNYSQFHYYLIYLYLLNVRTFYHNDFQFFFCKKLN